MSKLVKEAFKQIAARVIGVWDHQGVPKAAVAFDYNPKKNDMLREAGVDAMYDPRRGDHTAVIPNTIDLRAGDSVGIQVSNLKEGRREVLGYTRDVRHANRPTDGPHPAAE